MTTLVTLHSLEDMMSYAADFAARLTPGDIILMEGDLGAGKTTFVSEVCRCLGIDRVTSPTFTIVNRYDGELTIYHMDLYRLETEAAVDSMDLDDIFSRPNAVFFVEWASRLGTFKPEKYTQLTWELGAGESRRVLVDIKA